MNKNYNDDNLINIVKCRSMADVILKIYGYQQTRPAYHKVPALFDSLLYDDTDFNEVELLKEAREIQEGWIY